MLRCWAAEAYAIRPDGHEIAMRIARTLYEMCVKELLN
jgi:hypothetical protein